MTDNWNIHLYAKNIILDSHEHCPVAAFKLTYF